MDAVRDLYAAYVLEGLATFELEPPTSAQMRERLAAVQGKGLPWLVAMVDGRLAGYAYASEFRPRPAYRFTIEDSIYLHASMTGRGIGRELLLAVIERCEAGPWRQMVAVIGNSGNTASIALHRALGFEPAGVLRSVGFKLGQWVDTVQMQRALGDGDRTHP